MINKKRFIFILSSLIVITLILGTVALAIGDTSRPFKPLTTPEDLEGREPLNLTLDLYNMYGEKVLSTTTDEYKKNKQEIDKKYNIGEYSPAKVIIRYLEENGEISRNKIQELCPQAPINKTIEIMIKENVINKVQGFPEESFMLTNQMKAKLSK